MTLSCNTTYTIFNQPFRMEILQVKKTNKNKKNEKQCVCRLQFEPSLTACQSISTSTALLLLLWPNRTRVVVSSCVIVVIATAAAAAVVIVGVAVGNVVDFSNCPRRKVLCRHKQEQEKVKITRFQCERQCLYGAISFGKLLRKHVLNALLTGN